ncbi:LOW QUALITY PROTEIN: telomere repeats-binding bouquet formation protein 1 [Colossoma macropomum]|uniref:LOW QUALITY PROTEIN: telomere repeats-binding bouquet formation protein 1 n=1 Tax=Colossoma macropomum TaxID=42526 RepID=UPI001864873F|nr:LOW QUALITY PROTEIN: telomere repeats-binding bouquet formation protein 1 [Colossoma macropomum]
MLHAIKTDLHLLLECLKYQMKCPDSQKQALLTIVSICQQNEHNTEFFKEIGGMRFIYNLSRSSHYPEVKETALFTLGSLAEFNENCKQALCREETFSDLAECMKHRVSHTQKRVAVYMLCVLVSNNRRGQGLAKASGCIDILLTLFRDSFPVSDGPNEMLPLWASVSSALCGCVNNPQNEENQNACMCMFPRVKTWLQQVSVSKAELAQPICSFIGMAVANNTCVQEYFALVGGLVTLTGTLASVVPQCKDSSVACKIAVMITRTLSACIADNEALAPVLSELRVVPDLLLLLSSPNLSPQDQLAVVLTLGHCTDACVEHQSELMLGGGLPLMISLLTDANDEEVRKAAIFVLQTCKKITEALGGDVSGQSEECDLQRHWQSAQEILQRIQRLEKRQLVCLYEKQWVKDTENSPPRHTQPVLLRPVECREELWEGSVVRKVKGQSWVYEEELDRENILHMYMTPTQPQAQPVTTQRMKNFEPMPHVRRQIFRDFDKSLNPSQMREEPEDRENMKKREVTEKSEPQMRREEMRKQRCGENGRDEREGMVKMKAHLSRSTDTVDWTNGNPDKATCSKPPAEGDRGMQRPDIFRYPAPMKRRQQRQPPSDDELSLCSEILESEIERILITPVVSKPSKLRCVGCMSGVDEVNSRSVGAMLHSCRCLCEFHQVLQQAEDRFKRSLKHEHSMHTVINLTPLKRPCEAEGSNMEKRNVSSLQYKTSLGHGKKTSSGSHKIRKNYSADELAFLNEGVRRFGNSWNSILWAYPFQHGRTNIDLAKKYRKLKQGLAQAPDHLTLDSAEQRVH